MTVQYHNSSHYDSKFKFETRAENIFENLIFSGTRYGALRRCGDPVVEKTMIIHRPCQSYISEET